MTENRRDEIRQQVVNDFKNQFAQWTVKMEEEEIDRRLKEDEK